MISCEKHDYMEIVCLFRYPIKLTMKSGTIIECYAFDTKLNENRIECIKVDLNGTNSLVVIEDISILEICVDNPHFQIITFN